MQSFMLGMVCKLEGDRRRVTEENDQLGGTWARKWEEGKGSYREEEPENAGRTGGVTQEDMKAQQSKV